MAAADELALLIQSRYPLIAAETIEEHRFQRTLLQVAESLRVPFYEWSLTEGLHRTPGLGAVYDTTEPLKALNNIAGMTGEAIFFMKDLRRFLDKPEIVRKLEDLAPKFTMDRRVIVLLATKDSLPAELQPLAAPYAFALPTPAELKTVAKALIERIREERPLRVQLSEAELDTCVDRLRGMTAFEAERTLSQAIVRDNGLTKDDIDYIVSIKKELLKRDGLLEYIAPEENLAQVGGFATLKAWLAKRKRALEPAAKEFGIELPKGAGKTLAAKAVAREWLKMEPGRLYDKYIGESDKNLEKALHMAEAMAPCVLMIDEIEKGLSYSQSSESDAGLSRRIVGRLLGWLQDRTAPVFVIATSNAINQLPPELTRKGRFDEIFFIDLPTKDERKDILSIHLKKRKRDPTAFDLEHLAAASDGFTGAEIEQVVVAALYTAFSRNVELSTTILAEELRATKPLAVTRREEIEALRTWARERTMLAS
jgi:ATPase family associated with various cellular activities (AAA)/AAA+ lid domain